MLAARPAERHQGVFCRIVALARGNAADGIGHALVGDIQKALQQRFAGCVRRTARAGDFSGDGVERGSGFFDGNGNAEARRIEAAEQEIDVS